MRQVSIFFLFLILSLTNACGGSGSKSSESDSRSQNRRKEASKICATQKDESGCASKREECYFDKTKNTCHAKLDLKIRYATATDNALLAITTDGALFENPLSGTPNVSAKIKDLSSTNDYYCVVDESDELKCTGNGQPNVPPGTKAKQVSIGGKDNLCYRNLDEEIVCLGTSAAKPTLGVNKIPDPTKPNTMLFVQSDFTKTKFTTMKAGPTHTCGHDKNNTVLCMSSAPLSPVYADNIYLDERKDMSFYALGLKTKFFYNFGLPGFLQHGGNWFKDNFVTQGTKGKHADMDALTITDMSIFTDDKSKEIICVVGGKKAYCSSPEPDENDRIDLRGLNPQEATTVSIASDIVCAIDASSAAHCAHIFGQNDDKRVQGFVDEL